MIYIELMGGLGNQLFQIFCGIAYSLENKIPFKLKATKRDKVSPLDNISLRPVYWNNFLQNLGNFTYNNINLPIMREKTNFIYEKIPIINQDFKLIGYFQSYKYFDQQYDNIIKLIGLEKQKQVIREKYEKYFNNKIPISLHFRIGDYVKKPMIHPILTNEYYIKSLHHLKKQLDDFEENYYILICGEEIDEEKIEENIQKIKLAYPNLEIIICDFNIEDWEQMILMSLCSHNIIANSSFSWWGAYFNNNTEKLVCYPSIWIGTTNNVDDLFPENWAKVS